MNDFMEEDEECMDGFGGEDEQETDKNQMVQEVIELQGRDFKYEVADRVNVLAMMKGKLLELQNQFEFADIDRGVFWKTLRDNRFIVKVSNRKLEDKIFDYLESREVKKLNDKKYTCMIMEEELESHLITHLGCGHPVSKDCMKEFIENEITTKGRNSIYSTCPVDKCPFLLLEEHVGKLCDSSLLTKFQNFLLADFLEKFPCVSKCVNPRCEKYLIAGETDLDSKMELPSKDCACSCGYLNCLRCKMWGHQPIDCEYSASWRKDIEDSVDKLNLHWKKENTKKCPNCLVDVFKNTGCMHMICFKCKHEFCWMCLGDKKAHNGAHIATCNNPVKEHPSQVVKSGAEEDSELMKLKFCVNRFIEHENSLKILYQKYSETLQITSGTHPAFETVNRFVQRFGNALDFYVEGFKEIIAARSFLMYTYPLQYLIKNQQEMLLFFEAQNMFQVSLEKMTGLLERNQVDSFVVDSNGVACPAEDCEERKMEINVLRVGLKKHYVNLKKELSSDIYMKRLKETVQMDLKKIVKAQTEMTIKKMPDKDEIWVCFTCQKANKNSGAMCSTCQRESYVESYGAWKCSVCSNNNRREATQCENGYCKKGTRPKEAIGQWKCNLCHFENTANLSDKCRACNQKGC